MATERVISYELRQVDVRRARADVIALKYAFSFHGADRAVADAFTGAGKSIAEFEVAVDDYELVSSGGVVGPSAVLFVGVPRLRNFLYAEIRRFSAHVLTILSREAPDVRSVMMTVHGPGYGLDILESARQQLLGVKDAISAGSYPAALEAIVIADVRPDRLDAAAVAVAEELETNVKPAGWNPAGRLEWPILHVPPPRRTRAKAAKAIRATVKEVTRTPEAKSRIFVAMPFTKKLRDVWRFGIQGPAHRANLICERMDEEYFTGGIIERVRKNIEQADLVIADLTGENPNVFLEVGYAWGRQRPTLFLCKQKAGKNPQLPFDVGDQKCLFYEDATDLEKQLTRYLKGLGLAT